MSKHLPAKTVLAGAAVLVLAGCGATGTASTPQVSMGVGRAASSSARATAAASGAGHGSSTGSGASARSSSGATSNSYVAPVSIPFPDSVGDTWVYQTTANGQTGRTTDRIVSSEAAAAGYQVTMAQTVQLGGSAVSAEPVYVFYPDGKVGFPVPEVNGVSVQGTGVTWPDSAGLASGQAYHSVVKVGINEAGAIKDQNADVTVQGAGTVPVTVPAGTYLASLVNTTLTTQVDGVAATVVVKTWLAPNVGPVQSEVITQAGGQSKVITTNRLLSYTKGPGPADGS